MASVWRAWQAFERGKMASSAILAFRSNLEIELLGLQKDLVSGRYRHGSYDSFVVYEPKRREIAVAQVRDRVVHRLLYDYLVVVWDKSFCYDAWNCRKNKGLHGAISRAQYYVRRYKDSWIWRSDISKFFDNVDHSHLRFILKTKMASTRAMKLLDKVIDSYNYQSVSQSVSQSVHGLPIGNLTSQVLANIYLNEFDQFVLQSLKPRGYVRYGDDFVLWCHDELEARYYQVVGSQFLLDQLRMRPNPKHDQVQPACNKLSYLGVDIWPAGKRLDPKVQKRIENNLTLENASSYQSFIHYHQPKRYHKRFLWNGQCKPIGTDP